MPAGTYKVTVHELGISAADDVGDVVSCDGCFLTYAHHLVVNASLELTPLGIRTLQPSKHADQGTFSDAESALDAVAGDSILLTLSGADLLHDSAQVGIYFTHVPNAQAGSTGMSADPGPVTTARIRPNDYHTVLSRSSDDSWMLRVRVPHTLCAGEHAMLICIERAVPTESSAHGCVQFVDHQPAMAVDPQPNGWMRVLHARHGPKPLICNAAKITFLQGSLL